MKIGVVYKFKPKNKLNGTLFYCFEYFKFLKKYCDCKFYITDLNEKDLNLVKRIFREKYDTDLEGIIPIKTVELYKLNLDRTLILDIHTFYNVKEFLTNEIHCFSNDCHEMFRYKNNRKVIYYGSYSYQRYDVFNYLKLNFDIFKKFDSFENSVFISALNEEHLRNQKSKYVERFSDKNVIIKDRNSGIGNIFEVVDSIHYLHNGRDTNNRIIPEAFYYKKKITFESFYPEVDSSLLRFEDIQNNGLLNYTLSENDEMIKSCLR